MLNRLTVKQRMYVIIAAILALFLVMTFFAIQNGTRTRDMGITKTGEVMLADQKDKIKVASHSMALAVGRAIESSPDRDAQIEIIRKLIDDIRFEEDESGYFFVYEDTTCIALPPKKDVQGKDIGDTKDKNGVYLVRELRDKAQQGGGFVEYIWPKPAPETCRNLDTPR